MITTGAIRNTRTATASAITATPPGPVRCPSSPIRSAPPAFGCAWPSPSASSLEDALEPHDAVVACEAHQRQSEQNDRKRGGKGSVERDHQFALDQHGGFHDSRSPN